MEMTNMLLCQILAFAMDGKSRKVLKNNKVGISDPTWKERFELHDGSYSISDIQN